MPKQRIDQWSRGDALEARKLDQPRQAFESLTQETRRFVLSADSTVWSPVRFRIFSVAGDYIVCTRVFDSALATQTTAVAKPPILRNSVTSLSGVTYTYDFVDSRTADNGSSTEEQVIVTPYITGLDIVAIRVRGGTGVANAPVWMDLNVDGRMWAKEA